jgi:hypothetical protein
MYLYQPFNQRWYIYTQATHIMQKTIHAIERSLAKSADDKKARSTESSKVAGPSPSNERSPSRVSSSGVSSGESKVDGTKAKSKSIKVAPSPKGMVKSMANKVKSSIMSTGNNEVDTSMSLRSLKANVLDKFYGKRHIKGPGFMCVFLVFRMILIAFLISLLSVCGRALCISLFWITNNIHVFHSHLCVSYF